MLQRTLCAMFAIASLLSVATPRAEAAVISFGTAIPVDSGPPEVFALPIEITGAVALVTWQFDLSFDPGVVQVNELCVPFSSSGDLYCGDFPSGPVTEGPFTSSGSLFQTLFVPGVVDNTSGLVSIVAGGYVDLPPGPSGAGTLAYVEFYWVDPDPEKHGNPRFSVESASVTSSVPEPGTLALLASGMLLLGMARVTSRGRQSAPASAITSLIPPSVNQADPAEAAWLTAAREDPDPSVRLHALEVWAQRPGESLDPVTYALVDPDDSVRARAQELMERELARR